jgi:hypothetical protein
MSPIETGLRGDVTLAEVKARVGDRVCLKGNLVPLHTTNLDFFWRLGTIGPL